MTIPAHILFAISDTGGGHRSAAVALSAALQSLGGETINCETLDVLRASGVPGLRNAPWLYDQLSTRWLPLYDLTFNLTNGVRRVDMLSRLVYHQARRNIARELLAIRPELVVVTHPLTYRLVYVARQTYQLPFHIVTVVTDLVSLHASWIHPGVDLCLLPTDEAYALMRRNRIRPKRMCRTGFPVHPKFAHYDRSQIQARRELGLAEDRFTLLVTSGGVGAGSVREMVSALERAYPDKQMLVVTGKNQTLQRELRAQTRNPLVHIYGFVNNMETLMAASDVVVTKAGPGTLMESLVMRRPVIVTEAVGAQENGNIDFVLNHELGAYCPTTERIIEAVSDLTDQAHYAGTVARLQNAVPRDGAEQIASILIEQLERAALTYERGYWHRRLTPWRGWSRALRRFRGRTLPRARF